MGWGGGGLGSQNERVGEEEEARRKLHPLSRQAPQGPASGVYLFCRNENALMLNCIANTPVFLTYKISNFM